MGLISWELDHRTTTATTNQKRRFFSRFSIARHQHNHFLRYSPPPPFPDMSIQKRKFFPEFHTQVTHGFDLFGLVYAPWNLAYQHTHKIGGDRWCTHIQRGNLAIFMIKSFLLLLLLFRISLSKARVLGACINQSSHVPLPTYT